MAKPWEKWPLCTDQEDQQRRGARLPAPPPKNVRLIVGGRASAAVERPIILKSATEVAAEDARRRKALAAPSRERPFVRHRGKMCVLEDRYAFLTVQDMRSYQTVGKLRHV